jgi:hypothetical protein
MMGSDGNERGIIAEVLLRVDTRLRAVRADALYGNAVLHARGAHAGLFVLPAVPSGNDVELSMQLG